MMFSQKKAFKIAEKILMLFFFCCSVAVAQRQIIPLSQNWKYIDSGVYRSQWTGLEDSDWKSVNLPHTWNAKDCFDSEKGYRRGTGWYRKNLNLPAELEGKRIFLYFEAASQVADIFVNGGHIAKHLGGFSAFAVDITNYLNYAQDSSNLIAVKVDNSWNENIPPLGEYGFVIYGGLYRDAWLIAVNQVHFDLSDSGSCGVYIDTPEVADESATIAINSNIVNDSNSIVTVSIKTTIIDAQGEIVKTQQTSQQNLNPNQTHAFKQLCKLNAPKLWSPDSPYLYTVKTEIIEGEKVLDSIENPLGIRCFHFDPDKGFFLNGKHLKLKGTNRHQDYPGLGNAMPDSLQIRDIEIIKEMGANFVRLAHYQQDDSVLKACDELGLLVWEEIPVVFYVNQSRQFIDNCKQMLREMIKQHYNHPSIILWGSMNEPLLRDWRGEKGTRSDEYNLAVRSMAEELDSYIRQLDPTRNTVLAINGTSYHKLNISSIPQILGWNRYSGWYGGKPEDFGASMDSEHDAYPENIVIISEYGAGSDSRIHSINPDRMDFSSEYAQFLHEEVMKQIKERDFIAGSAIWSQFDFCNPYNEDTIQGMNQKGLMHYDRTPKDVFYMVKASYSDQPVVYIASREWNKRAGTDSTMDQPLKVYSNLEKISLLVNGNDLGTQTPDQSCTAVWNVKFKPGKNVIEAEGLFQGQKISDNLEIDFHYVPQNLSDGFDEISINVGSRAQFIDAQGIVWMEDKSYTAGGWGYIAGQPRSLPDRARKSSPILNTDDDPLYQRFLTGIDSYRFDVPDGQYELELRFADYENDQPEVNVFDVTINGSKMIENLDLVQQVGSKTAFNKIFKITGENQNGIMIDFKSDKGLTVLSAVRIKKL